MKNWNLTLPIVFTVSCVIVVGCGPASTDQTQPTPVVTADSSTPSRAPVQQTVVQDGQSHVPDLTPQQKASLLQQYGYPTDGSWDVIPTPDGRNAQIVRASVSDGQNQSGTVTLPHNVHYVITRQVDVFGANPDIWFSEDEPKPYGSGYKFRVAGTSSDLTVTGNITIEKIR